MFPLIAVATITYIAAFILAPPVAMHGIRALVAGSLLYGNNIITGAIIPSSIALEHTHCLYHTISIGLYVSSISSSTSTIS
jgi:photosystem II P680 reaction center D1 protein